MDTSHDSNTDKEDKEKGKETTNVAVNTSNPLRVITTEFSTTPLTTTITLPTNAVMIINNEAAVDSTNVNNEAAVDSTNVNNEAAVDSTNVNNEAAVDNTTAAAATTTTTVSTTTVRTTKFTKPNKPLNTKFFNRIKTFPSHSPSSEMPPAQQLKIITSKLSSHTQASFKFHGPKLLLYFLLPLLILEVTTMANTNTTKFSGFGGTTTSTNATADYTFLGLGGVSGIIDMCPPPITAETFVPLLHTSEGTEGSGSYFCDDVNGVGEMFAIYELLFTSSEILTLRTLSQTATETNDSVAYLRSPEFLQSVGLVSIKLSLLIVVSMVLIEFLIVASNPTKPNPNPRKLPAPSLLSIKDSDIVHVLPLLLVSYLIQFYLLLSHIPMQLFTITTRMLFIFSLLILFDYSLQLPKRYRDLNILVSFVTMGVLTWLARDMEDGGAINFGLGSKNSQWSYEVFNFNTTSQAMATNEIVDAGVERIGNTLLFEEETCKFWSGFVKSRFYEIDEYLDHENESSSTSPSTSPSPSSSPSLTLSPTTPTTGYWSYDMYQLLESRFSRHDKSDTFLEINSLYTKTCPSKLASDSNTTLTNILFIVLPALFALRVKHMRSFVIKESIRSQLSYLRMLKEDKEEEELAFNKGSDGRRFLDLSTDGSDGGESALMASSLREKSYQRGVNYSSQISSHYSSSHNQGRPFSIVKNHRSRSRISGGGSSVDSRIHPNKQTNERIEFSDDLSEFLAAGDPSIKSEKLRNSSKNNNYAIKRKTNFASNVNGEDEVEVDLTIPWQSMYLLMFQNSPPETFTKAENRGIEQMLSCFEIPPTNRTPMLDQSVGSYRAYEVDVVPKFLGKTQFAGISIGICEGPINHCCAWFWDFCCPDRIPKNSKSDIHRAVVVRPSDHRMTTFARKWLPPPFGGRDFFLNHYWKRLDDNRICIITKDNLVPEEYNGYLSHNNLRPQTRMKMDAITLFEGYFTKEGKAHTKMTFFTAGHTRIRIPKWLLKSRSHVLLNLVGECMSAVKGRDLDYHEYHYVLANGYKDIEINENKNEGTVGPTFYNDLVEKKDAISLGLLNEASSNGAGGKDATGLGSSKALNVVGPVRSGYYLPDSVISKTDVNPGKTLRLIQQQREAIDIDLGLSPALLENPVWSSSSRFWPGLGHERERLELEASNRYSNPTFIDKVSKAEAMKAKAHSEYSSFSILACSNFFSTIVEEESDRLKKIGIIKSPLLWYETSQPYLGLLTWQEVFPAEAEDAFDSFHYVRTSRAIRKNLREAIKASFGVQLVLLALQFILPYGGYLSIRYKRVPAPAIIWLFLANMALVVCPLVLALSLLPAEIKISRSGQYYSQIRGKVLQTSISEIQLELRRFQYIVLTPLSASAFLAIVSELFVKGYLDFAGPLLEVNGKVEDDVTYAIFSLHTMMKSIFFLENIVLPSILGFYLLRLCVSFSASIRNTLYILWSLTGVALLSPHRSDLDSAYGSLVLSACAILCIPLLLDLFETHLFSWRVSFSHIYNDSFPLYTQFENDERERHVPLRQRTEMNDAFKAITGLKRQKQLHPKMGMNISSKEIKFVKEIGRGRSGVVYLAQYRNNIVAVKTLSVATSSYTSIIEFAAECELMAQLKHPNIIRFEGGIFDFSQICLVMEYAKAGTMRDTLTHDPFLDWKDQKKLYANGICTGMEFLHNRRNPILHRDLKTSNCLLTELNGVKISDFGESRVWSVTTKAGNSSPQNNQILEEKLANAVVGTQFFMAPEIFRGEDFTAASDVYSFGCVLADIAMSGKIVLLYTQGSNFPRSPGEFQQRVASGWRADLPGVWRDEHPTLTKLIDLCWQHDPKDRPSFEKIKGILSAWDGEVQARLTYEHYSKYVRHVQSNFDKLESEFIQAGLKCVRNLNVDEENGNYQEDEGESIVIVRQDMKHAAWEVCELAFDFLHPERMKRGYDRGDTVLSLLEHVNEHHLIVFRQNTSPKWKRVMDVAMRMIWQEASQGNYIIHARTIDHAGPNFPSTHKPGTRCHITETLWVQQSPDGATCTVTYVSVAKGLFKRDRDTHKTVANGFVEFLDMALNRKLLGVWAARGYGDDIAESYYDLDGFSV